MFKSGVYTQRLILVPVLVALGASCTGSMVVETDERAQMVRALYAEFTSQAMQCEEDKMSRFFSADIVNEFMKACEADAYPPYPIIPGNDFDDAEIMRTLKVVPVSDSAYMASFRNFGTPETVTYTFEKQGGQWRITDVQ
jgi:hypothetical protein